MRYGYARVSTNGQDYAAQVEALKCRRLRAHLLREENRQVDQRPPRVQEATAGPNSGDIVVVTRLDRLVRSSRIRTTPYSSSKS